MLLPGFTTDLRVAREVYDFTVDVAGRILSDDNLGRPVAVPEVLTRWSHNRLAARQLLDYCADERGWFWCLERDGAGYRMTFWVQVGPTAIRQRQKPWRSVVLLSLPQPLTRVPATNRQPEALEEA